MLGSIFLIYNSFNMSLNERTQQFGILSSVGATAKQLRNSVLFEGFCIGMIGIPIGIAVGIISIGLVISVISKNFASILFRDVPLTLTLSAPALIAAAAVSLLTILISAYIPARKAANTPVMECIRQTNEVKNRIQNRVKTLQAVHAYLRPGRNACTEKFQKEQKRYRSIILSLVLSIVLFISTSALTADMKRMSSQRTEITDYDIIFSTQDLDDGQMLSLYEKLKTARGVYDALYQEVMAYSCAAGSGELSEDYLRHEGLSSTDEIVDLPVNIQFLEDSRYENILKELGLSETEYTGENAKFIAVSMTAEDDRILTVFRNSSVKITLIPETDSGEKLSESKNIDVAFVDFVPPDSPPARGNSGQKQACFQVLAPYSAKGTFEFPDASKGVKSLSFQSTDPSLSASEMETIIEGEGITGEYSLYNMYQMMDENRNYIFIANVFAYTFIVMISMIAVANVFNTISTNIKLRRRELAMPVPWECLNTISRK
ncbi:MAG: FtsX-like permease family protein, partial [Eisenbergiella sp.]